MIKKASAIKTKNKSNIEFVNTKNKIKNYKDKN